MNGINAYNIFPNEDEKKRARELLATFGEPNASDNLENRLRKAERNSNLNFNHWKESKYHGNSHGMSFTSIGKKRKVLVRVEAGESLGNIQTETDYKNDIATLLQQCEETANAVEQFISEAKTLPLGKNEKKLQVANDNSLAGSKWAAYFLHYKEDDRFHGLYEVNEAMIGRAIVRIKEFDGENPPVSFQNTKLDDVVDYIGNYQSHMDLDHGLVIFDLEAAGKRKRARNIHIKVYCTNPSQEILLGQYTTYERGYIQSGNIIFQNLTEKVESEVPEADTFSFLRNWDQYSTGDIPEAFRLFLSERVTNYNILKLPRIRTEEALKHYNKNYRPTDDSRFERFLERYKPRVFLAAPSSEANLSILKRLKGTLDEEFDQKLHVTYKEGDMAAINKHDTIGGRQPYRDIEKLKTTRFFILLLDKPEHLSYSHLQFGIAMTLCKVVIVIGKEEYMSKAIVTMRPTLIMKIKYLRDLETEWEAIVTELIRVMKRSLTKPLGGEIEML